jgi:hypothetical protein
VQAVVADVRGVHAMWGESSGLLVALLHRLGDAEVLTDRTSDVMAGGAQRLRDRSRSRCIRASQSAVVSAALCALASTIAGATLLDGVGRSAHSVRAAHSTA